MTTPTMGPPDVTTDTGENADLARALKSMRLAAPAYQKAHLYYQAEAPEMFASHKLRRAMARSGMTLQMNFSRTIVDSVVDRLELASIRTTDGDAKTDDDLIDRAWKANKLDLNSTHIMRKALEFGDAYALVWPKDEADPRQEYMEPAAALGGGGALLTDNQGPEYKTVYEPEDLRVIYQDPRTVRVFYNSNDPLTVDFVAKRWLDDDDRTRIDLYYEDRIECYISQENTTQPQPSDFLPFSDINYSGSYDDQSGFTEDHVVPNPFDFIPFFHFRTDADDYGTPEHKHFYPIHDAIHKLALGHITGVDYQAFPQRFALMADDTDTSEAARLDEAQFSFAINDETEPPDGEATAQFSADPGSVWMANSVKHFGQFDAADPTTFTGPIEFYLRCGATITNTPLHYFEPAGTVPSGEALRTEEAPFIKKVKNRQLSFGDTWTELFTFLLKCMGRDDPTIQVRWVPAETNDDVSAWEVAQAKQAAGVPVEQTLIENGYSQPQVEEWQSNGQGDLPQRVQLFFQVGQAMASFATAVGAGVVKAEQVDELMGMLLGDISAGTGEDDRVDPPANPVPPPKPVPTAVPGQPLPFGQRGQTPKPPQPQSQEPGTDSAPQAQFVKTNGKPK